MQLHQGQVPSKGVFSAATLLTQLCTLIVRGRSMYKSELTLTEHCDSASVLKRDRCCGFNETAD
jgi:hypothetical protein